MRGHAAPPRQSKPKGSEIVVGDWLREFGCDAVEYVGDSEGPPDFLVWIEDKQVAVEATLLLDGDGWEESQRIAFEAQLRREIETVQSENPNASKWHTWCSYDPIEAGPPKKHGPWRRMVKGAILGEGGVGLIQLLTESEIRGRGVRLHLTPATNAGSFAGVSSDEGSWVLGVLSTRVEQTITKKSERMRAGKRAAEFDTWWLVLDDEILYAPEALTDNERTHVTECVHSHPDRNLWSKIVLVSKYQTRPGPPENPLPIRYWVLWDESCATSELPT